MYICLCSNLAGGVAQRIRRDRLGWLPYFKIEHEDHTRIDCNPPKRSGGSEYTFWWAKYSPRHHWGIDFAFLGSTCWSKMDLFGSVWLFVDRFVCRTSIYVGRFCCFGSICGSATFDPHKSTQIMISIHVDWFVLSLLFVDWARIRPNNLKK